MPADEGTPTRDLNVAKPNRRQWSPLGTHWLWWLARAMSRLPVPVSPSIRTVVLVWATLLISSKMACICGFLQVTEDFLGWRCGRFAAEGKRVSVLVWDNAAWHARKRVRRWIGAHHRRVKREGGCKIRVCYLPVEAPWRNAIEPKWVHGKRAIIEPDRKLTGAEIQQRVRDDYHCQPEGPLKQNAA